MLRLVGEVTGSAWELGRDDETSICGRVLGLLVLATGSGGHDGCRNKVDENRVWKNGLGDVIIADKVALAIFVENKVGKFLGE